MSEQRLTRHRCDREWRRRGDGGQQQVRRASGRACLHRLPPRVSLLRMADWVAGRMKIYRRGTPDRLPEWRTTVWQVPALWPGMCRLRLMRMPGSLLANSGTHTVGRQMYAGTQHSRHVT